MMVSAPKTLLLVGALSLFGCELLEPPPAPEAAKSSKCALDVNQLEGQWVKIDKNMKATGTDPRTRIRFYEDNGTQKAIAALGTIDKHSFTLLEDKPGRRVYLQDRDAEVIENFKAKNTDPKLKLQTKIYLRVNEAKCQLQFNDAAITYVNGEVKESETTPRIFLQPEKKALSWDKCTDAVGLHFSETAVDASKIGKPSSRAKPLLRLIPANKPAHFYVHYADSVLKEGCKQSFSVYDEDVQFGSDLTTLSPGVGGQVFSFEKTFAPHDTGRFVEVYRHETCADGVKVAQVSCGVVKPE